MLALTLRRKLSNGWLADGGGSGKEKQIFRPAAHDLDSGSMRASFQIVKVEGSKMPFISSKLKVSLVVSHLFEANVQLRVHTSTFQNISMPDFTPGSLVPCSLCCAFTRYPSLS